MIGGVSRHGRTQRDARNLAAHLLKDSPAVLIANSVAPDLESLMEDMLLARDGTRASSAFLHMHLSPSRDMSGAELRKAAMIVLRHFEAADHPAAFVIHEKPREGGEGVRHCHVVVGRVGLDGSVLPAGFEKIRLETAVRIAEFELGERPVLGRHHASALCWLRQHGREDVAGWLEAAHGPDPKKPRSAVSPRKRQALERQGGKFPEARAAVKAAWATSGDAAAFRQSLVEAGLSAVLGDKRGVWIVKQVDVEIGALDRILRMPRKHVAAFMAAQHATVANPLRPPLARRPPRPMFRPEEVENLTRIDLDELRWRAESFGRAMADSIMGGEGRDWLRASIQVEIDRLSTKGASRKPVHAQDRPPASYDTLENEPPRPFRR